MGEAPEQKDNTFMERFNQRLKRPTSTVDLSVNLSKSEQNLTLGFGEKQMELNRGSDREGKGSTLTE